MRRLLLVVISLLALVLVASAAARDPRLEQLRLTPADTQAARASILTRADLRSGWHPTKSSDDDTYPDCAAFSPNFSKFVITGKAGSKFNHSGGATLESSAEVYASHAQAVGDFLLGRPQFATCLRHTSEAGCR